MAFTNPLQRRGMGDFYPKPQARPHPPKPPLQRRGLGDFKPIGGNIPRQPSAQQVAAAQQSAPVGPAATPQAQGGMPGATSAAVTATVVGAKADALEQYVAGITDPQERAYVEAQIGPQIAALNAQRDALLQQAKDQQAAMQGFTSALIDQLKGVIGAASGPYADIAASQVKAGQAAGQSLAAANPSGGTDAILKAIGAPNAQLGQLNELDQNVFGGGGAVLTGTGGTIPSFATAGEGLGVLGWATAQPGIAASLGEENYRQLLADQAKQQGQYGTDLQTILSGIPKAQQDYETQQQQAKDAAEQRAMSLYNSGLITQRDLAHQLNLPNWQKYPDTPRGSAVAPKIYKDGAGNTYALDPSTGKVTRLPGQPKPVSVQQPTRLTFKNINGRMVGLDPYTGKPVVDLGVAGTPRARRGAAASKPIYRQGADGRTYLIDPKTNTATPVPGMPGRAPKPGESAPIMGPGGVPLTKGERYTIGVEVQTDIAAIRRGKDTLMATVQRWKDNSLPEQIWAPLVWKAFGLPNNNVAQLKNMTVQRLHQIAVLLAPNDLASIPKPRKGGFNKQELIQFITPRLLNPKGNAAQGAAYSSPQAQRALSLVSEYIGVPYVWGGETPKGFDCSGLLQYVWGKAGVSIPRTTFTQWTAGRPIARGQLQPGDAVFFVGSDGSRNSPGHVGMYIGNGKFIEAPHTGSSVRISSLAGRSDYVGARRFV